MEEIKHTYLALDYNPLGGRTPTVDTINDYNGFSKLIDRLGELAGVKLTGDSRTFIEDELAGQFDVYAAHYQATGYLRAIKDLEYILSKLKENVSTKEL